jgi:hypothetical protein
LALKVTCARRRRGIALIDGVGDFVPGVSKKKEAMLSNHRRASGTMLSASGT